MPDSAEDRERRARESIQVQAQPASPRPTAPRPPQARARPAQEQPTPPPQALASPALASRALAGPALARPALARQEQALRAAWLYYVAGRTQDEIAVQLNISRQGAQRLVSRAVAEKLIRFRFDHPIATCMELGEALTRRFGLSHCHVVPSDPLLTGTTAAIAIAGAQYLEHWFGQRAPMVIGFSTGRTLRAIAEEMAPVDAPQHKVFSLCGTMSWNGRAGWYDPLMRVAERTGAQLFPMPTPLVAATVEECRLVQSQRPHQMLRALAEEARCLMVGVGHIGWQAPLHQGGFITDPELTELIEAGAVGEIASRSFDAQGRPVDCEVNNRVISLPLTMHPGCVRVAVAGGLSKVVALRAALAGGLVNAMITDEVTADGILQRPVVS